MKKLVINWIIFFVALFSVYSEISFSTPELNPESQIIFSVTHSFPGETTYSTLFTSDLDNLNAPCKQITTFPEQMTLLSNGQILRIRNRYGISLYNLTTNSITHNSASSQEAIPANPVRKGAESVSPDGKWICTLEKTSSATAAILLENATGYTKTTLVPSTEFSYNQIPVKWSPDSSLLVYEKEGNLYFTEPEAMFRSNQIPEHLRKIGSGSIHSVYWASEKKLIYIQNDIVYDIPLYEMYTRAIYSDFVGIGTIIGRLPFSFDATDRFSINPDTTRIVLIRDNRTVTYMTLPGNASFAEQIYTSTQSPNSGETYTFSVYWSSDGNPLVWLQINQTSNSFSQVYSLNDESNTIKKTEFPVPKNAKMPLLSPDGKKLFFTDNNTAYVYSLNTWQEIASVKCGALISCLWANSQTIYLGGRETLCRWNINSHNNGSYQTLFPSSAEKYAWNNETGCPVVLAEGILFEYDLKKEKWNKSLLQQLPNSNTRNGKYRTFLGTSPNSDFTNAPYVRSLSGPAVTQILYTPAAEKKAARPVVSLAFDAIDNADGLATILHILENYNIKATFFINGEFLRRYPEETRWIVSAGHECGSMFYTATDLIEKQGFVVDETFIRRGLARNEDEFFSLTGSELSLIWHAPFYKANQLIQNAGRKAGYTYIPHSIAPKDNITLEEAAKSQKYYLTATEVIEEITATLKDGGVIPISVGISSGNRSDYLYDKLDLLIGAILDAGYNIVTVGSMHLLELPVANTNQPL
ncbi:MAG: polysaccharide deacetylase family protein [Spirochaetaceae bacterium]|nr:polysaccharide deacetylase family protein [Spirochaetaceae bacterium]